MGWLFFLAFLVISCQTNVLIPTQCTQKWPENQPWDPASMLLYFSCTPVAETENSLVKEPPRGRGLDHCISAWRKTGRRAIYPALDLPTYDLNFKIFLSLWHLGAYLTVIFLIVERGKILISKKVDTMHFRFNFCI